MKEECLFFPFSFPITSYSIAPTDHRRPSSPSSTCPFALTFAQVDNWQSAKEGFSANPPSKKRNKERNAKREKKPFSLHQALGVLYTIRPGNQKPISPPRGFPLTHLAPPCTHFRVRHWNPGRRHSPPPHSRSHPFGRPSHPFSLSGRTDEEKNPSWSSPERARFGDESASSYVHTHTLESNCNAKSPTREAPPI